MSLLSNAAVAVAFDRVATDGKASRLQRVISVEGCAEEAAAPAPATPEQELSEAELGAAAGSLDAAGRPAGEEPGSAAGAVSDDEEPLPEPEDRRSMSLPKHMSAMELMKGRQTREAAAMWDQIIKADPDKSEWYHNRGMAHYLLNKEKEAVQDFTICLEMRDCVPYHRFQSLLLRGQTKQIVGDLAGADADFKAAQDAAQAEEQQKFVQEARMQLTKERIRRRKQAEAKKKARAPPVVHRYRTATIEELEPEEDSEEHSEEVAHKLVEGWQEAALKRAAEARGAAARIARELEAELARVREENQARSERNAVRQARRRCQADLAAAAARRLQEQEAAAAAAAAAASQRGAQRQGLGGAAAPVVIVERTLIPIEVVRGSESSSRSSSSSGKQAGYESDSESSGDQEEGEESQESEREEAAVQQEERQQQQQDAAGAPAPVPATAVEQESEGQEEPRTLLEDALAALRAAEALAAADVTASESEPEGDLPEAAAGSEGGIKTANDEPAALTDQAAPAVAHAEEAAPAAETAAEELRAAAGELLKEKVPSGDQLGVPALLSEAELDALKEKADALQRVGDVATAEKLYARYLVQRPADQRVWSNRAENFCKALDWERALECCHTALAISSPSHLLPRHKLLFRRGAAYRGLDRLQEALRSYEEAEAAAEAEGEDKVRKVLARHIAQVLEAMAARGIQPAPTDPALLGVPPPALLIPPEPDAPAEVPSGDEAEAAGGATAAAGQADGSSHSATARAEQGGLVEDSLAPAATAAAAAPPARDVLQESAAEREAGNEFFKRRQWELALRCYDRAGQLDPGCKLALANKAAALLKLRRWGEAVDAASQALIIDSQFTKARYRRAHAYRGDGNLQMALLDMQLVAAACPDDAAVSAELADLERLMEAEGQKSFLGADLLENNPLFRNTKP